jgi:hypothetical protein
MESKTFDYGDTRMLLARTPTTIRALVDRLPDHWLDADEGSGTWSPRRVVGHLILGERGNWMPRLDWILHHGAGRAFESFNQAETHESGSRAEIGSLLAEFESLRATNLAKLDDKRLTPAELDRPGLHPALGAVTLRQLLATWGRPRLRPRRTDFARDCETLYGRRRPLADVSQRPRRSLGAGELTSARRCAVEPAAIGSGTHFHSRPEVMSENRGRTESRLLRHFLDGERVVVSRRSLARLKRSPVIHCKGLTPVVAVNRRDSVRLLVCAARARSATVMDPCSRPCAQCSNFDNHGCAASPMGLSMYCAWPPSRWGGMTARRATRVRDNRAKVLANDVQAQVDARGASSGSEDVAFVEVQHIGFDADQREGARHRVHEAPVGGGASAVQKTRGGQDERPHTKRNQTRATFMGLDERTNELGRRRCDRLGPPGDDDRVGTLQLTQAVRRHDGDAANRANGPLVDAAHGKLVPLPQLGPRKPKHFHHDPELEGAKTLVGQRDNAVRRRASG